MTYLQHGETYSNADEDWCILLDPDDYLFFASLQFRNSLFGIITIKLNENMIEICSLS